MRWPRWWRAQTAESRSKVFSGRIIDAATGVSCELSIRTTPTKYSDEIEVVCYPAASFVGSQAQILVSDWRWGGEVHVDVGSISLRQGDSISFRLRLRA